MANEFKWANSSGLSVYLAPLARNTDGEWYNTATPGFESPNASHWANYLIAMTEQAGTGVYYGNLPAGLASNVMLYDYWICLGNPLLPLVTDIKIAQGILNWNGSADVIGTSTYAGGAVASVTAGVTVATNNDKTGYALSSAGLDAVVVETGLNARQALSIIASSAAGVLSGATTGASTILISAAGVSATNRVTATTDSLGNRSSVTLTPPA